MKRVVFIVSVVFFLFSACKSINRQEVELIRESDRIIDVTYAINNPKEIALSEIADSITFIKLETTENNMIGGNQVFRFSPDFISANRARIFDWDGNYITKIGTVGRGPLEEPGDVLNVTLVNDLFYSQNSKIIEYDRIGNATGKVKSLYEIRGYGDVTGDFASVVSFSSTGKNLMIYNYPDSLYFFDTDFNIVKGKQLFGPYKREKVHQEHNMITNVIMNFYDITVFNTPINDTIFHIKDTDVEPAWIIDIDKKITFDDEYYLNWFELTYETIRAFRTSISAAEQTELIRKYDGKLRLEGVYETTKYVFLSYMELIHWATERGKTPGKNLYIIFNKETGEGVSVHEKNGILFKDDLLGMDNFFPKWGVHNDMMISSYWPHQLISYVEESKKDGKSVHPRILELVASIAPDDNPVLFLVHLKR